MKVPKNSIFPILEAPEAAEYVVRLLVLVTTAAAASNNNIGHQLQAIVSQLANDIDSTKGSIDTLTKTNAVTQKAIQDLEATNDRVYMIGLGALEAGVAGIVIAAAALSRRNVLEVS